MPKTIALCDCDSSRIARHGFCPETNTLRLQFRAKGGVPGRIYEYAGFPPEKYKEFQECESKGTYFAAEIAAKDEDGNLLYPYTRLPDDPEDE